MADGTGETRKILKADDFSALSRARTGVAEAEQAAAQIIAQAKEDAERIRLQAEEQARFRVASLLTEHAALIARDMKETEAALSGVVMTVLHRLLDPVPDVERVTGAARRALKDVGPSRNVELFVAPDIAEEIGAAFASLDHVAVHGDPTLGEGSSLLKTPYGNIELGLSAQLRAVADGLEAAAREGE